MVARPLLLSTPCREPGGQDMQIGRQEVGVMTVFLVVELDLQYSSESVQRLPS